MVSVGTPLACAHHGWIGKPIDAAYSDGTSQRLNFHDHTHEADRRFVGMCLDGRANATV